MTLVAFCPEESVEAFGQSLTLRLDFRAITTIEGALGVQMPIVLAELRGGAPSYSILGQVLWAMFREYNPELTLDHCMAIIMDRGADGAKVGLALDALLERAFPMPTEDRKPKNVRKSRAGRSKSSAVSG